jgi:hypothetical protein
VYFSSHHHFYKLSCFWLLDVCCCSCLLQLAWYEGFPLPLWCSGHPTLFATCLFCCYCLLFSFFSLSLDWSVQGGYADLAQGCLWEVCVLLSSPCGQAVWVLPSGGSMGALLVSLFNVKWRCYAQTGRVEESKFCFFSVVFPVRYISSVSPRFYFRKHAFCFLPLAAMFLISSLTSSVIHWSLINVLFSLQLFEFFLLLLLLLSPSFIALWLGRMQCVISIFLYLLRLAYCPKIWSILEKVPWIAEKNVYLAFVG